MPELPFAAGDRVIHLAAGLAEVIDVKEQFGESFLIVRAGDAELPWIPARAWREHLRPLPTRVEAEAWRTEVAGDAPSAVAGKVATRRRLRTLRYPDLDAQVDALHQALACGDRSDDALAALTALEARILPIYGAALGVAIDELRAALRDAHAGRTPIVAEVAPLPALGIAKPLARFRMTGRAWVGDPGYPDSVQLSVHPGTWLGYQWELAGRYDAPQVVAICEAYAERRHALLSAAAPVGWSGTDCAQALILDGELLGDDAAVDEITDPVGDATIAGRGVSTSLGGDGDYEVRAAEVDGRVACIIAGASLTDFEHRLLAAEDPETVCVATIAAHRLGVDEEEDDEEGEDEDGDLPVDQIIALVARGRLRPSAALLDELERLVADPDEDPERLTDVRGALARAAPGDALVALADHYGRTSDRGTLRAILTALTATRDPAACALVAARLGRAPWADHRVEILAVLHAAGHPGVAPLLEEVWRDTVETLWTRAHAAAALLGVRPACDVAGWLLAFVDDYPNADLGRDGAWSGHGAAFDPIADALTAHATGCERCHDDWLASLERVQRVADERWRRLIWLAPQHLARLRR